MVALLVRPDRPRERNRPAPWLLGVAAVFCLCTYVHSYLVLLPGPFAVWDGALRQQEAVVDRDHRLIEQASAPDQGAEQWGTLGRPVARAGNS